MFKCSFVVAVYDESRTKVATYTYTDAWGNHSVSYTNGGGSTGAQYNPFRYRGYYYDTDLEMYYLQSRYYDPNTCRFINADGYVSTGQGLTGYNMFAYCGNNPVNEVDPSGYFGLNLGIVVAGAIVGGLLGAFSALTTDGNVLESAVEGALTGAIGATCGLLISSPIAAACVAGIGGAIVDFSSQVITQYTENGSVNIANIDFSRVLKTGAQTGIGAAIPAFGAGSGNAVDAFGTALIWGICSAWISVTDVIITNIINKPRPESDNSSIDTRIMVFNN